MRAHLNICPVAGDIDSDAVTGYVLAGNGAAGMSIGLDDRFGDALLRYAVEGPHDEGTVVIKNSVLPKTFFDGERLAECARRGAQQHDTDQDSHDEMNLHEDAG